MTFAPKTRRFTPPRPTRGGNTGFFQKEKEVPLTGKVQNLKAAQGEERLARTLDKATGKGIVRDYKFRWTTLRRNTVGFKELDFHIIKTNGEVVPISVKGKAFVHFGTKAKEQDKLNEIIILTKLRELGFNARKVETVFDTDLMTQDMADKAAKKLGLYR